jgi:drug/metabolite transporter (DMT)-like permease
LSWDVTVAVLVAAALHAGWNALIKRGGDPLFETALIHGWVALPALAAITVLPWPGTRAAACLAASCAIHVVYYHALAAAYRSGHLSLAYPVMRGSAPLLTATLGMLLLDEIPSAIGGLGIAAVAAGVLLIGYASAPGLARDARRRSISWALVTAAAIVAYTLVDAIGARSAPSAWSYLAWFAALQGPLLVVVVLARHGRALTAYARERGALAPLGAGCASMLAYGIALWAMTRAPVGMVAALRESSVLFALIIARVALGERFGPMRWLGGATIVAGIAALRLE